jgi:hypothetical protein
MKRTITQAVLAAALFVLAAAPAHAADPVAVAVGDIACGANTPAGTDCVYAKTADLAVAQAPTVALLLGDTQYENGELSNYQRYFSPTWGRLKSISRPVPGNHEYGTANAAGYFDYFNGTGQANGAAGARGQGYYSFNVGSWHVVSLNSNCSIVPCYAGSAQERWLRADLAANTQPCTLAQWHHPRWSSDINELTSTATDPLVQALYDSGADLLLAGHAHDYERFAPQDPDGTPDTARGITQIVVGTGGRSEVAFAPQAEPNSIVRKTGTYGVLRLNMHSGSYDYKFLPIAGQTWTDSGAGTCHKAASSQQRVLNFAPSGDTYANSTAPTKNFGKSTVLIGDGSPQIETYLKFTVAGLNGAKVKSAKLRLYNVEPTASGGSLNALTTTSWSETGVTWNNRPAAGSSLGTFGALSKNTWGEFDVTPLVKGDGTVAVRLATTSGDQVAWSSNEAGAASAPQLVVTAAPGDTMAPTTPGTPTANPASPTRVELNWPASSDDVGVTGYRVYRDGTAIGTAATPTYADTTVGAGSTHSYAVTAYDAAGNESAKSNAVSATTPTGTPTATLTFTPTDDSYVDSSVPSSNFGGDATTIYDGSPQRNVFLKFNVSGIGTHSVLKTVLHLNAENGSVFGGTFQKVANTTWTQGTLTWTNQPAADSAVLATLGETLFGNGYDVDVTGLVTKDGAVTVRISSNNADGGGYYSSEGGNPAKLVVTTG